MSFNVGDRVLVNGGVVAYIKSYDIESNIVVWERRPRGGGSDVTTSHISNTRLEALDSAETSVVALTDAIPAHTSTRNAVTNDSEKNASGEVVPEDDSE